MLKFHSNLVKDLELIGPGGGGDCVSFQHTGIRGCAIHIVKVPPIYMEKFL